jgi:hypothetical protein
MGLSGRHFLSLPVYVRISNLPVVLFVVRIDGFVKPSFSFFAGLCLHQQSAYFIICCEN